MTSTQASSHYHFNHGTVDHKKGEHVIGTIHTNTIEGFWSLFERQLAGQHHWVSIKHLQRYLDEFSYRFNRRNDEGAFTETVRRLAGFKPIPFARLTGAENF